MFWADRIVKKIIDTKKYKPYWVDDMFTPSGFAHIGSLRGPLVHDLVFRALKEAGKEATYTYIFNDFDPIDGLPPDLQETHKLHLGLPLRLAPSPVTGFASFAEYFSADFTNVLKSLGVEAQLLSSWDLYHQGKFDESIKIALDNAELIQDIYKRVSGSKKKEKGWLPLQVVCENCGKLGTTRVHDWDGKIVGYTCEKNMVKWATGCGFTGRTNPFTEANNPNHHPGKLPWKVDWPAHWKVLGVTIEGAGKDHSSAGGSRDIAKELCKYVFKINNPFNLPYEFFLFGGKKMSSSKGIGLKGRDLTSVLPPAVGKFLFTRTDYKQSVEFDPFGTMAIPDLFDEYDRCWLAFINKSDDNLGKAFYYSQINTSLQQAPPKIIPRFRDIANYIQLPNVDLQKKFEELKGESLNFTEKQVLSEREKYARVWIGNYAPLKYKMEMSKTLPVEIATLKDNQKKYLHSVIDLINKIKNPDDLQLALFNLAKEVKIDSKQAFAGIYISFLGKTHGPRAAWFLLQYPKNEVINRLKQVTTSTEVREIKSEFSSFDMPEYFFIIPELKKIFPNISIGIALIKNVSIEKSNQELESEKSIFLNSIQGLTTEQLGQFPEIISYRKLYREMKIDWHSRRPSPEALLRRVAQGRELYKINTCVDAYNLIVMKYHISVGAFDADQIKFPTVLRYASEGDEILLLGDEIPTKYTSKELAYYDKQGGYNIDFNYRDAQRSMVTENTKNLWINVDGVYDITPEQVQRTLDESIQLIMKYCGGNLEFKGVVK